MCQACADAPALWQLHPRHQPSPRAHLTHQRALQVAPTHTGIELGIGDSLTLKALSQASGRAEAQLKKEAQEVGDLGEVAMRSKGKQRTMFQPKALTIQVCRGRLRCWALCVTCQLGMCWRSAR